MNGSYAEDPSSGYYSQGKKRSRNAADFPEEYSEYQYEQDSEVSDIDNQDQPDNVSFAPHLVAYHTNISFRMKSSPNTMRELAFQVKRFKMPMSNSIKTPCILRQTMYVLIFPFFIIPYLTILGGRRGRSSGRLCHQGTFRRLYGMYLCLYSHFLTNRSSVTKTLRLTLAPASTSSLDTMAVARVQFSRHWLFALEAKLRTLSVPAP